MRIYSILSYRSGKVGMQTGRILDRWNALDQLLGCPIGPEVPVDGGHGTRMPFLLGEIVTSPDQGPEMVVAAYQAENSIIVNWSDSSPFNYDFFIVRWDKDGRNVNQIDVRQYIDRSAGFFHIPSPLPGDYSILVEGCDDHLSGSSCKQGWTVPVHVTYRLPEVPEDFGCGFGTENPK